MRTRVYTSPVPLCAQSPPEWFLACFSSMPAPLLFCRLYPPPELKLENRGACVLPARSLPYFWPGFQEAGFKCSLLDNCTARCFHWGNILFSRLYFWMESLTHVKSRTQCLLTCRLPRLTKHSDLLRTTPVSRHHLHCLAHGPLQSQQCWVESFSGFIISLFFPLLSLSFDYKDPYIEVT